MAETKIIDIKINGDAAFEQLRKLDDQITELQKTKAALDAQSKTEEGLTKDEQNLREKTIAILKDATRQQRELRKTLENQVRQQTMANDSLKGMRANLSNLTQEYDELTAAERNAAKGKDLAKKIKDLSESIKEAEEETNRFYRNVGNYQNSIGKLFESTTMGKWFNTFKTGMDTLGGNALKGGSAVQKAGVMMKNALSMVGSALKALLANPVLLVLAAITAAVLAVVKAMKSSEERMNALRVASAPLQMALDLVSNALSKIADGLVAVISGVSSAVTWFTDLIGVTNGAGDASEEYTRQIKEEIAIEKERRQQRVESSKQDLQVAQLRDQIAKTDKKNYPERVKLLKQALDIEQKKADKELELTTREYELAKAEAARTDNDKEANDKLAEAEAKMYQAQTQHLQETRKLQQQLHDMQEENLQSVMEMADKFVKAVDADVKAEQDANKKKVEEAKAAHDKMIQEQRRAIDITIALIKDENDRQRATLAEGHRRTIEDLKKRLTTEKGLNKEARKAIREQMRLEGEKYQRELEDLNASKLKAELEKEKYNNELRLAAMEDGDDKALALKLKNMEIARDLELENTKLTEEQKKLIREKYAKQMADAQVADLKARDEKARQLAELTAKNEILKLQTTGASELEILKKQADQAAEAFATMTKKNGEQDEEYKNRLLEAQKKAIDTETAYTAKRKENNEKTVDSYAAVAGSLAQVADAIGQGTAAEKAMKKVSAALGLVTSGVALAKGISSAAEKSWPENIAAIASVIAEMTPIISNIKTLTAYAEGGTITAGTTEKADDVQIMASRGEAVMTARAVRMYSPLLSAMNQSAGGAPVAAVATGESVNGGNFLAQQMASAMAAMPAPRVAVTDFISAQNRLNTVRIQSRL